MHVPHLVVGAAIVDSLPAPRRLLAARRTTPPELAGRWELPGGKVEPGEDPEDALIREVHEELRLSITLVGELRAPEGGAWPISSSLRMRVWLAVAPRQQPEAQGSHDEVRWVSPADWRDLDWLEADRPILDTVRKAMAPPPRV